MLTAIADRADDAHDQAEHFARELADDEGAPAAMRARAALVVRAFERGDPHALDRAIDLLERLLEGAEAQRVG